MPASTFQTLPPPIIDLVLRYLLRLPTEIHSFPLFKIQTSHAEISPLYHTCQAWRTAALSLMFARCTAVLGETVSFTFNLNECNPRITNCLDSHLTPYVKTISASIDYNSTANGSVLAQLERTFYMLKFVNAYSLVLEVRVGDSRPTGGLELSGIAERTLEHIKNMMPPLNHLWLSLKDEAPHSDGAQYRQLRALMQGVAKMPLSLYLELDHPCQPYIVESCVPAGNLTKLTCVWSEQCAPLACIIRSNLNSLLELHIAYASFAQVERLVVDEHGNPAVYPHLTTLVLSDRGAVPTHCPPQLELAAPFPRLRVFQSHIKYPFGDDVVFRGNSSSLENIYIMGDFKIIKMLSGCGVFAKGRLRSLHKLVVADSVMEIDNVDAVIDTYMGVIGNVLPGLTELRAVDADISDAIIALLTSKCSGLRPSPPKYENLQLLSLYRSFLTLTDMVRLLQSLPHLRTLGNRVSGLGNDFRNTNSSALGIAEIMRSQFNPLNHFFKRWRITNTTHFPENFVIASILLLADVCPGLETIIFDFKSNDAVEQLFKKMVGSKLYANCQGRLSVSLNNSYRKPAMHIRHTSCGPDVGTLCV